MAKEKDKNGKPKNAVDTTRDWLLVQYVDIINMFPEGSIGFSMTLVVGGVFVSGMVIGGKEYFELLANKMEKIWKEAGLGEAGEKFRDGFKLYKEFYDVKDGQGAKDSHYIHLKDATLVAPGAMSTPTGETVLLRFRISEVSGFSIGQFKILND